MANTTTKFGGFLTNVGIAQQTNANALGVAWSITHMLIGDAGGEPSLFPDPTPNPLQTALVHQVYRAQLNALYTSPTDAGVLVAELALPPEVGGWWIRELALEDAYGNFVATATPAPSYKPLLAQGSGRTQTVRMHVVFGNTANVTLKIDPSVVLATREYVDASIISALNKQDFKHSVLVASTAPITLSGVQTVDGVVLAAGNRVLIKNQPTGKDNGIYNVSSSGAWSRAADADSSIEVTPGLFVHVEQGTTNADSIWQLTTDAPIVLGTTALAFERVSGRTGVAAGTYRSVTVDANGRVVGGTNPKSLSGYGIDIATQVDAEAGADEGKAMTPLRVFQAIAKVVVQATESAFGWAKVATQVQVDSGTDDETFITPKKNRLGFHASLAQNGYIVFPRWMLGLIIQWGKYAGGSHGPRVSFPIAFTTQTFVVITGANDDNDSVSANSYGLTWFTATQLDGATATNVSSSFFWLALGK